MDLTTISLQSAIKAMEDVVLPAAAASDDPHAGDQAVLATEVMRFVQSRISYLGRRHRFNARAATDLAHLLVDSPGVAGSDGDALATCAAALSERLTGDDDAALEASANVLYEQICEVLDALDGTTSDGIGQTRKRVLEQYASTVAVDRAWLMPLGFYAGSVGLETALAQGNAQKQ